MVAMPEEPDDPTESGNDDKGAKTLRGFLTSNDLEAPIYFAYRATLRIFGSIQNLDEITQTLGLVPTHVHQRGELRHPSAKPYDKDMWLYEAPVEESKPLHVHIDALWEAIRDKKEYLLDLKRSATVDVFCGYRTNCDHAGVDVPHQSLQIFEKLEVPFGLSIIIG
jgi:hypothetical protein